MRLINSILNGLSETGRLFVIVFFMSLASILISFWTGGLILTIIVSAAIITILTITKNVWESDYGTTIIFRTFSVGAIYCLTVSQPQWKTSPAIQNLVLEPLIKILPIPKELLSS
jgi:hypothetical protein